LLQAALTQVATFPLAKQWLPSPSQLAQNLAQQLDILLNTLVSAVTGVRGLAVDLVLVSVLAYFFSTSTGWEEHLLSEWMPPRYQPRAVQNDIGEVILL
jgi:predicted PurR-regulated permease PerM